MKNLSEWCTEFMTTASPIIIFGLQVVLILSMLALIGVLVFLIVKTPII